MSSENYSNKSTEKPDEGFPIQLKILLVVIVLGVLMIVLKTAGVF